MKKIQPKILEFTIAVLAVGAIFGASSIYAQSEEEVPDWFRGVAGFWAEDKISTDEFLNGIEFLAEKGIIEIPEDKRYEIMLIDVRVGGRGLDLTFKGGPDFYEMSIINPLQLTLERVNEKNVQLLEQIEQYENQISQLEAEKAELESALNQLGNASDSTPIPKKP